MYNDENRAMALAKQLNGFDYVLIDTCSLMEDAFPAWMDRLVAAQDYLEDSSTEIYVPKECIEELERHSKNKKDFDKRGPAKRALKILKDAKRRKLITILKKQKKDRKSFADNTIYVKVSTDRLSQKILVITQDKKLASDLIALNNLLSQRGRNAHIMKFEGTEGNLVPNRGEILPSDNKKSDRKPSGYADKSHGLPKPISGGPVKPVPGVVKPLPPEPKKAENKAPIKEVKPAKTDTVPASFASKDPVKEPAKKPLSKAHSATGNSLQVAISSCASGINLMFRYPSIPYAKQFHGDVDLTEADLEHIVSSLEQRKSQGIARVHYSYKGFLWSAEPMDGKGGYRAWIEKIPAPESAQTPIQPKGKDSLAPTNNKEVMPNGVVKVIKASPAPKAEETKTPAQTGMSDEEYASVKEGILSKLSFVSARALKKSFGLGPYRASKVIRRMQEEHLLGTEPNPQHGFPVIKKDSSVSSEPEVSGKAKPVMEKAPAPSTKKKTPSAKPSTQKENSAPKAKTQEAKAEPAKKPAPKTVATKKPSKPQAETSKESKADAKKTQPTPKKAVSKASTKKASATPAAKPALKAVKEEHKPSEKVSAKQGSSTAKTKQLAPKKAPAATPVTASEPRLIVLAPTNDEERKAMDRRAASRAKPKAAAPKNESKDFGLAKEKEKALQALMNNPATSKAALSKAIDDQLVLIERLTPSEKRKLTLHKTQLLVMKKF